MSAAVWLCRFHVRPPLDGRVDRSDTGAPARCARAPAVQATTSAADPDCLYADREHLASAERAAAIWEERLAAVPTSFGSAWKLSRVCYWLGGHGAPQARRRRYERGIDAGRQAAMIEPNRPEGYVWMAASMAPLAESYGLRTGLRYRGAIRHALEIVREDRPFVPAGIGRIGIGRTPRSSCRNTCGAAAPGGHAPHVLGSRPLPAACCRLALPGSTPGLSTGVTEPSRRNRGKQHQRHAHRPSENPHHSPAAEP